MDRQTFARLETYMCACMQDCAHDREHVYRVLYNALEISREEVGVNLDVLITAALLHDISRSEQLADSTIDHASHGADKAYAFLRDEGFPEDFCAHVRACIRTHRFRKAEPPASPEAAILFDADKLDVSGAIGIARTLAYSGTTGRPIYTRDAQGAILDGSADAEDSFFREYRFKLEGIYDHFLTRKGGELAAQRRQAAAAYCAALLAEVRGGQGRNLLEQELQNG